MILAKKFYQLRSYIYIVGELFLIIPLNLWHLIFGERKEVIAGIENIATLMPLLTVIDQETLRCVSCGLCEMNCPVTCIEIKKSPLGQVQHGQHNPPEDIVIDLFKCISCGLCEKVCPVDAIQMRPLDLTLIGQKGEFKVGKDFLAFRADLNGGQGIYSTLDLKDSSLLGPDWISCK